MGQTIQERAEAGPTVFARNVYKLAAGTSVAQLLPVLAAPLLTRLYSPAEIGLLAGFIAAAALLATAATARYAVAVVLPAEDQDAAHLALLAGLLCLGFSAFVLIVLLAFRPQIAVLLDVARIPGLPYLASLAVLLLGTFECLQYWMTRRRRFGTLAKAFAVQSILTVAIQVTWGLLGGGPRGLLAGYLAGLLLATALLAAAAVADRGRAGAVDARRLRSVAARYLQFPKFDLPNAFVHALGNHGILLALTGVFGFHAIGFYSLAERVLITPFRFFTQSFGQVFYQRLAEEFLEDPDRFARSIRTALSKIIRYLTVPFLAAVLLSRFLVVPIFGQEWQELHRYLWILAPLVYLTLLMTPLAYVLKIVDRQQISLGLNCALFVLKLVAVAAGGLVLGLDVAGTLSLLVAAAAAMLFVTTSVVLRQARVRVPGAVTAAFGTGFAWSLSMFLLDA